MAICATRPEMMAGPIWRALRLAKVRVLIGSSLPLPPRPPGWAGSSCARAASETHNRIGNSFMAGVYRMAGGCWDAQVLQVSWVAILMDRRTWMQLISVLAAARPGLSQVQPPATPT